MARVAILGGGVTGCVLADELARGGCEVTVMEAAPRLGGLHRSVEAAGLQFDVGAFVFGDDHAFLAQFPEVARTFPRVANRFGSVRESGAIDDYPMTIGGARRELGDVALARAGVEVLIAKLRRRRPRDLRAFVEYYIGPTLYQQLGLKAYIERLYLIPDTEVDIEFAETRLSALAQGAGLRAMARRVLVNVSRRPAAASFRPPTGEDVRVRPVDGFDAAYQLAGACLARAGVEVALGTPVTRIGREGGGFVVASPDAERHVDAVFSTVPLGVAARALGVDTDGPPPSVALYSLFYTYRGSLDWPHNVMHNFTMSGQWKRLTVFSRYYGTDAGRHYFTVEGTAEAGGETDVVLADGEADFDRWLAGTTLLDLEPVRVGGVVTRQAYPVYKKRTVAGVQRLKAELERRGLVLVGRQGAFDYISSSDAAANAVSAARRYLTRA